MKKIYYIIAAALCLPGVSCDKGGNTGEKPDADPVIAFQCSVENRENDGEEFFYNGGRAGVFAVEVPGNLSVSGNWLDNEPFRKEGPLFVADRGKGFDLPESSFDIIAYYPYDPELTSVSAYEFEAALDQSDDMAASDFLYAKKTGVSPQDRNVSVAFGHLLSKLRIKLVKGEGGSLENIMPVLHDVKYGISIDLSDGTASTGSATADITSNRTSEIIREAILPAQTISKNTHFLTVREGVEPLLWIPQEDVVFAADRVKEIEITVYSNYATIKILGDIEGWDDDEDPVEGTV